jgi:hypothetical protein
MKFAGHLAYTGHEKYKILVRNPEGKEEIETDRGRD